MEHSETKEKIVRVLRTYGPLLPVHISTRIDSNILFTSAFLSELLSEKKVKMSQMRVGSSPIYFINGQENQLERYIDNIKGKEKEALILLKEKKFLKDKNQETAIRVALRSIKDFAIPFQKNNELYWRYFTEPENEFGSEEIKTEPLKKEKEGIPTKEIINSESQIIRNEHDHKEQSSEEKTLLQKKEISEDKSGKNKEKIRKKIAKKKKPKTSEKANEKFFNKIKEHLAEKQIEILSIEGFSKKDLTLKIKEGNKEKILVAYNKKRLTEKDIMDSYKKIKDQEIKYVLLSTGEQSKKLTSLIEAIKNLDRIEKIE
jgi:hypothetical protein